MGSKSHYAANRERILEERRLYRLANLEKVRAQRRANYRANIDKWKQWRRETYLRHKERFYKQAQAHYLNRRKLINEIKAQPCADCGIQYPPYCMDFDHVRGKKIVAVAKLTVCSLDALMDEIGKCDLVCANCHRKRTYLRRKNSVEPV